ncbi:MAG: hypothetical protein NMNS01_21690 [Nitrosomonas sp.]|nr:MAG: hypothetical protein NMNS01_21690 [Nitrosomonas sp.]
MAINMKERVEADKEIKEYLDTTDKSDSEKQDILEKCWKDDNERNKWMKVARQNKQQNEDDGSEQAAVSHNDKQQQVRDAITSIEKSLITRARIDVHQAIQHGNGNPLTVAQDAVSKAIAKAVDDIRATTTLAFRK